MIRLLALITLLVSSAALADAPVIWNGSSARWLPSALNAAGVCSTSSTGVMSIYTTDGILKMSSGVPGAAVSGTDYAPATSGSSILKGNGAGGFSAAASGTDYAPPSSGTGYQKGNGSGGFTEQSTPIPLADGGTNKNMTAAAGGLVYTDADSQEVGAAGTSGQAAVSGGTGAPTWFAPTSGSIVVAGINGVLQQDNSNFFYNYANHRFGVQTTSPLAPIHFANPNDLSPYLLLCGMGGTTSNSGCNNIYTSNAGTTYFTNPYQGWNILQLSGSQGRLALGGFSFGHPDVLVGVKNQSGLTTIPTLGVMKIASQTAHLYDSFDSDESQGGFFVDSSFGVTATTGSINGNFTITGTAKLGTLSGALSASSGTVTAGTLSVANGGTGQSSFTDGQILIGNSSGNTLNKSSLTAGAGISIANGGGSITISTSGGSVLSIATKNNDYIMTNSDDVILVTGPTTTGSIYVTMQAVSGATSKSYKVKNLNTSASVVIRANGSDVFDRDSAETEIVLPPGGVPASGVSLIPDSGGSSWSAW